ncbi:MAG: signal peptidase I [Coriobacteriales bacterium]|jgi:signal peptidase I|nr:signal peptidase I [Coriobacteriales bacterium]
MEDEKKRGSVLRLVIEFAVVLVVALLLTWLLRTFVFEQYEVPSASMQTTIMTNDRILAEKITYAFASIEPGDIVVFDDKTKPDRILVKRVVATEGQTIDFLEGKLVIDGQVQFEPYVGGLPSEPLPMQFEEQINYPYTVPQGCIWVMGDNRTNSSDSRYFGPIETSSVLGHVFAIAWPIEDMRLFS